MKKVVVVDSGSANLNSIVKGLEQVKIAAQVSREAADIESAQGILFPGVGAFGYAAEKLQEKGLTEPLLKAISAGVPFLGICLGMQLLFSDSEEAAASHKGLGAIPGRVKLFPAGLPVPHVGWNQVVPRYPHPLFEGLDNGAYFYFTHSYYVEPANSDHSLALTEYGHPFTAATANGTLMGVQFHPEKSGSAGLRLLSNFGKIIADPTILNL